MKKKKEFFRIRKDRKRKNGANARACTCIHRRTARRPFAAFETGKEEPDRRPRKNPLTVYSPTEFSFLNRTDRVLFSKLARVSEPTLFCFLNRSPYACACVCICTQNLPAADIRKQPRKAQLPFSSPTRRL